MSFLLGFVTIFLTALEAHAQFNSRVSGAPVTLDNAPQNDTASSTNTSNWKTENISIHYQQRDRHKRLYPDTSIHFFHRRPYSQPFYSYTGNSGSPALSLLFMPEDRMGPTLGYHVFDVYRYRVDSLGYYNTTHPYTVCTYQLGSKTEQLAHILHTRNIHARWNITAQYQKINSPGYYKSQRTNHDNTSLSTSYMSRNLRYKLYGALVYNKFQNDENGGIISDSFLTNANFIDRKTIPVAFQNDAYSLRRSAVTNMHREFSVALWHHLTFGKTDTLYNDDSTQYYLAVVPRFRLSHHIRMGSEKYQYKDLRPDSLRYSGFFQHAFVPGDSVFMEQKWFYTDNELALHGFLGAYGKQLQFSAGAGLRTDLFQTQHPLSSQKEMMTSNYLIGSIKKEALTEKEWDYEAKAKFYVVGPAAGNFRLEAHIGKEINKNAGRLQAGFRQELNRAPYNYTFYANDYYTRVKSYNPETITRIFGNWSLPVYSLDVSFTNYIISNYYYINEQQLPDQLANTFSITQLGLHKLFRMGRWVLDNELLWQQQTAGAPVNIPALSGRHQLSLETYIFRRALKIATGVDVRYHTAFTAPGYSPFLNRYFYQTTYQAENLPEMALFFNFHVKRMRMYIMGDQLQQMFSKNTIYVLGYPYQNAMIRFGFTWAMIN